MSDKRISQLVERTAIENNDVLPIVALGASTTNKVTITTIEDYMQANLDMGVTSVGLTKTGDALAITGSPITSAGNINIAFAGTSGQYVNGAGNLATFPTLTGYVPYTGATTNVNLGEFGLTAGYYGFDLTPTGTPTGVGTMYWDTAYRTISLIDGDGDTTLQIGQEQRALVHNNTGATLTDGQVVYVTGSTGNLPSVALASNNLESSSSVTFGVVTESIPQGADGFVTISGNVSGLNTLAFNEGDALYLGSTPGTFTNVKPVAPANLVLIGYMIKKAGGNGSIFVKIQNGYELEELHDVLITSVANNQGLFWDSATSLWKNKSIAAALGYTPADAARNLTINGTTYNLTADRTWDVGTVTSVGLSAPTGFSVTGSPVTGSGTLGLSFAAGYSLPTNIKQGNWDDAYTFVTNFPTQTGNAGKFLSTNGSVLSWETVIAGVQSVTASSPLFSSGGANPNITIQQATTSQNGFLSSTDWNTFNSKQNALTNPVTGTGNATSIAFFNGASTITSSTDLYWDNGNKRLGIKNSAPRLTLDVEGGISTAYTGSTLANKNSGLFAQSGSNIESAFGFIINDGFSFQGSWDGLNDMFSVRTPTATGSLGTVVASISKDGLGTFADSVYVGNVLRLTKATSVDLQAYTGSAYTNLNYDANTHNWQTGGGTAKMVLTNGGNLLVGTTTDAGFKLSVNGTMRVSEMFTSAVGNNARLFTSTGASTGYQYMDMINTGGRIVWGIESSSPNTISTGTIAYASVIQSTTSTPLQFGTNGSIKATLTSSGNLGINTSTAEGRLTIYGDYSGGTGDLTNVTNPSMKIIGVSTYWRLSHISGSGSTSGVYNYETGKDVYWGEPSDAGNYYYRGRNFVVGNSNVSGGGALQVNGNVNINGVFQINGVTIGGGGGSGVTGSGTSNYVTKWTGSSTIGNSGIYDAGGIIGIGTNSPAMSAGASQGLNISNTTYIQLRLTSTATNNSAGMEFFPASGNRWEIQANTSNKWFVYDRSSSAYRFTIHGNGNVTLQGDVDNGYKLQINEGSASFAYGYLSVFRGSSSPNDILVGNDGSRFYIGGNTYAAGSVTATGGFFDTSDSRLKTLLEDNYTLRSIAGVKARLYTKDGRTEVGYYAQDIQELMNFAVSADEKGFLSLSYAQVHTAKISVIEDEVTILKNRVTELEYKLQKYEA